MAEPARRPATTQEPPPLDPSAVERAYRLHRARRRARIERRRETRLAHARFWAVLLVLVAACLVLVATLWHETQRLFGL